MGVSGSAVGVVGSATVSWAAGGGGGRMGGGRRGEGEEGGGGGRGEEGRGIVSSSLQFMC